MDIQDLIIQEEQDTKQEIPAEDSSLVNLDEVEKIASLLDAASKEDTLMDEIAKLAVLNDFFVANGVTSDHLEKVAFSTEPLSKLWDDVVKANAKWSKRRQKTRVAKQERKKAKHERRVAEIEAEAAEEKLEAAKNLRAAKNNRRAASDSRDSGAIPVIAGVAAGAVGGGVATKAYLDKKKEKEMRELAEKYFYAGADAAKQGGA